MGVLYKGRQHVNMMGMGRKQVKIEKEQVGVHKEQVDIDKEQVGIGEGC